jgi:hypothetical protein
MRRSGILHALGLALLLGAPLVAAAAPPGSADSLRASFAQPEQTVEYHFMLVVPALPEDSLAAAFGARIAAPLRGVAGAGPLGPCETCAYVDASGRGLARHNLIVRVRDRHVTVKARGSSLDRLADLPACTSRKYEEDEFVEPEYSISSDLKFHHRDDVHPFAGDAARVWEWIARECPELWRSIRPAVEQAGRCEMPGIAHMYSADLALHYPGAAKAQAASLTVWYFPPTRSALAELSFTGAVHDRAALDVMARDVRAALAAAGLLGADQSSKTEQYFGAYARSAGAPAR